MQRWTARGAALLVVLATTVQATTTESSGLDRIEAALAALGGIEALDRAGGITWSGTGRDDIAADVQYRSSADPDFQPLTESLSYSANDGRLAFETQSAIDATDREWIRRVFDGNGLALTVDRESNVAFWDDRAAVTAEATMHRNMIVHELLSAMRSQGATLQPLPEQTFFDQHAHPVSGRLPDGTQVILFFDHDDVLLGAEYPLEVPLLGPVTMTWVYDRLVHVEGLGPYPAGHRVYLDDRLIREVRYEELHAGPDPALMRPPEGVEIPAVPIPDRA